MILATEITVALVCSAGMSTSILVKNIETAAKEQSINIKIKAYSEAELKEHTKDMFDLILVAPQVRYLLSGFKEMIKDTPIELINMQKYGMMDGTGVLADILNSINSHKDK